MVSIKFLDLYTVKARFAPALFNLSPSILLISLVLNKLNFNFNVILGSTIFSGLVFPLFFSEICRSYGKKLEKENYIKWGGKPSIALLRKSDNFFDKATKDKLYKFILEDFNINLEKENSDENIKNAINHINSYFNKNKDYLVINHKIEYGFVRNLAGSNILFSLQLFAYSIFLIIYFYLNKDHQSFSLEYMIILMIYPLSFIISLLLGKYVYPEIVKDREFTYSKTLLNSYYRESNYSKK